MLFPPLYYGKDVLQPLEVEGLVEESDLEKRSNSFRGTYAMLIGIRKDILTT